jgi:parallel beta-helix repeat protein
MINLSRELFMKKTMYDVIFTITLLTLLLGFGIIPSFGMSFTIGQNSTSNRDILYVGGTGPGNYSDIQEAIDNAENGDTIFVYIGDYPANIVIDKSITLIGESREETIIQDGSDGIFVFADKVTITNFTITHCGGFWDKAGILVRSNDNTICYNDIVDNGVLNGIYLELASFNKVYNNLIENCQYNGLKVSYSTYNNISGNFISTNNGMGIILHDSSNNNIFSNTITKSYWGGINIYENSNENLLFHNNLIENDIQNGYDICSNTWDNSKEGNYWDDYEGEDNNGDGIGDIPYTIVGNTTEDNYPLMNINEIPSKPSIDGPVNVKIGEEYEYLFTVNDPNDDEIFIYVNWGDNTNSNWIGPYESGEVINILHSWSEEGKFIISARGRDSHEYYGFSATKEIHNQRNRVILSAFFTNLFERFPLLERLIIPIISK